MSGPGVAHRLCQLIGQSARVTESQARKQSRPLGRQASSISVLSRKPRALSPDPGQEPRRRCRRRHRDLARVKHPRAICRLKGARLVEISGITRSARDPQFADHKHFATLFQISDRAPPRQPDERALNPDG